MPASTWLRLSVRRDISRIAGLMAPALDMNRSQLTRRLHRGDVTVGPYRPREAAALARALHCFGARCRVISGRSAKRWRALRALGRTLQRSQQMGTMRVESVST